MMLLSCRHDHIETMTLLSYRDDMIMLTPRNRYRGDIMVYIVVETT